MLDELVITSFNCKNIKSSVNEVQDICDRCDIVLLQETWLQDSEMHLLNNMHEDFYATGLSSMDTSHGLITGRPHGGTAILWRKSIGSLCSIKNYGDPRIIGIEVRGRDAYALILNVYLPYCCYGNSEAFDYYLSLIDSVITDYCSPYVYVIGDFNADTRSGKEGVISQMFGKSLVKFCEEECIVLADKLKLLDTDPYTFYSEAHDTFSWLDHVVTTNAGFEILGDISIDTSVISSDHFPVTTTIYIKNTGCTIQKDQHLSERRARIKWEEVTPDMIEQYRCRTVSDLGAVPLNHSLLMCTDPLCDSQEHVKQINNMYNSITEALLQSSDSVFTSKAAKSSFRAVPGWNDYVKASHEEAREAFLLWQANNKPKQGHLFNLMKCTRARFKYSLRYCKSIESRARADALANKLLLKDDVAFWKNIKALNKSGDIISNTVDGISGEEDIANMWQNHYSNLLNSNKDTAFKQRVLKYIKAVPNIRDVTIDAYDMQDAIKGLKVGKSPGKDSLQSEHYKYADKVLFCLLAMVTNCMLGHGYLPDSAMESVIIPILKDKKGILTDKNNYRPVAITSVFSKVLESIILDKFRDILGSADNQFGFKNKHSTDLCVFSLKQVIEFYHSLSTPVYVCFLDASKAFDRLNHWSLFYKLANRGLPVIVLRLFVYWYSKQEFCVRWGNTFSSSFYSTNGVRQGGIISPVFFNLYMDNLSDCLTNSNIGCNVNGMFINHLLYADDSCIMAPSPAGLQKLLDICCDYAKDNTIIYNELKTKCVCFKPKSLRRLYVPNIYLNKVVVKFVDCIKYLGVMLSGDCMDDDDLCRHKKYLYAKGNMLIKSFIDCTSDVKTRLFKTFCYSTYGGHLWTMFKKESMTKVKVAFNDVFRHLFTIKRGSSISCIFVQNNIDSFFTLLRKSAFNFRNRLMKSENAIINTITSSVFFYSYSSVTAIWNRDLFV